MSILKRIFSVFLVSVLILSVFSFDFAASAGEAGEQTGSGNMAAPQATYSWSINSYLLLDGVYTTTPIIPAVTGSTTTYGYILNAVAQDVTGYVLTPWDQSPKSVTLTQAHTDVNFYYAAKTYTMTFQSNGGTDVSPITASYKTPIAKPSNPTKAGYTFAGWFYDQACTSLVSWPVSMPLNGVTFYASWSIAPATITFISNDGSAVSPITANPGITIDEPVDPVKTGFRFDGWFYDINLTQIVSWPLIMPSASLTMYAKWTYVDYTLLFDSNGGTAVSSFTVYPGTPIYAPVSPYKTGYTFAGWYYDNTTFMYAVQWPVVMGYTGFTVYAKWEPQVFTITFDSQGGSAVASISGLAGTAVTAPEPPRKFGYLFTGWYYNSSIYDFNAMPTQNITLTASWAVTSKAVWVKLDTFKTVGGALVPASTARAGDIVTVNLSIKTNFYCGASRFIIMYDSNFYSIVGANKAAIHPNTGNAYYINAIDGYAGATTSPLSQWPTTFVNGESSVYKFIAANFTASSAAANGGYPVKISDDTSLFSIQLKVKSDASGSGRIFMDKRWDRSTTSNPNGQEYYYYCANATTLSSAGIPGMDLDSDYLDADETVTLDTSVPVVSTISFDTAGGSAISPISGEAGTTANAPADPVREGYTFKGWSPSFPSVFPESNITLTAQWQINSYTAKFISDGQVYAEMTVEYGAAITVPGNPYKVGNTFTGWSPAVPSAMPAMDKTFTAMFQVNTYNAVFKVDGVIVATVATEYGAVIQPPANPVKEGYTFTGWSPTVGTMGPANKTYTAQFTINTYNAVFKVDGEIYATVPTQFGSQIIAPENPVRAGSVFMGWSPAVGTMGAANQVFDAQWDTTSYNAYFMSDGVLYKTVPTVAGQPIALPENPAKEGYTFTGWDNVPAAMPSNNVTINATWSVNTYTAAFVVDGNQVLSVPVAFGASIQTPASPVKSGFVFSGWDPAVPAAMPAKNMTFYAVFTANMHTVTFIVDSSVYTQVQTGYGEEILLPANPVKTGYTFAGWLNLPLAMPDNDVTVTASFSKNNYTASFFVDGAPYSESTVPYGSAVELPADPDIIGYTFTGWDYVPVSMPDHNVVINATFSKNTYNAVFKVDGVEYAAVPTGYGENIDLPAAPGKTGYTFVGWENLPQTMPAEDIECNAKWAVNSYDAVFYVDGVLYSTVAIDFGAKIQLPVEPVKSGYYFGGWSPLVPASMPAHSLEFTAQWVSEAYDAVFMVDGVEYARVLTGLGAPVIPPADPVKEGFIFIGWDPGVPSAMPAYDVTMTALWFAASNITVSFNLNGSLGTVPASQSGQQGTAVNLPDSAGSLVGMHALLGWSDDPHAAVPLASYLFPSADTTLYAVWSAYMLGDTNLDGTITVIDALLTLRAAAGLITLDETQAFHADVNRDGNITVIDALLILRASSGIITQF